MSEFPPLIYVDLVADKPQSYAEWVGLAPDGYPSPEVITGERKANYRRYIDDFQPWRILIKSGDNQEPLFRSTESYFNKADAEHAAHLAFGAGSNVYLRQAEHGNQVLRMATP